VKLSEAQSYLIKATDKVNMVICDGFTETQQSTSPFPQPPVNHNLNQDKTADLHLATANSNYDNLRNIDSDDSSLLLVQTPDISSLNSTPVKKNPYLLINNQNNKTTTPQSSQSLPVQQTTTSTPMNINDKNLFDIIKNKNKINNLTTMSEIIPNGKTNGALTTNGSHNKSDTQTPADTVRSFRDRMKFFENIKEVQKDEPKRNYKRLSSVV
jgi:hypothetical protein